MASYRQTQVCKMETLLQLHGQDEIPKSYELDDGNLCETPSPEIEKASWSKSPSEDSVTTTKQPEPELISEPVIHHTTPVHSFLRSQEIQKFTNVYRHLQVARHHFRIIGNRGKAGGSLYRALSQAITTEEQDYPVVRQVIAMHLVQSWSKYGKILVPAYRGQIKGFTPEEVPDNKDEVMTTYLRASIQDEIEGTFVELLAAAKVFGFDYTVILPEEENDAFRVVNCQDEKVRADAKVKYFFIRSGKDFEDCHWEFLAPYNRDAKKIIIPAGIYSPINILHVYPFHRGTIKLTKRESVHKSFGKYPTVLALTDGRLYGYYDTRKTDIFSNLSILMYGSVNHGQTICDSLNEAKLLEKKEKLKTGTFTSQLLSVPNYLETGNIQDIEVISKTFFFTYAIYSLDEHGNLTKAAEKARGYYSSREGQNKGDADKKHYTLLYRCRQGHPMEWHIFFEVNDPTLKVVHGEDYAPIDLTKVYFKPLYQPFTKKKKMFGIKYRSLRRSSLKDLKHLMGVSENDAKKSNLKSKARHEAGYLADQSSMSNWSTSSDNESDKASVASSSKSTNVKEAMRNLFWKGSFLLRNRRVAPITGPDTSGSSLSEIESSLFLDSWEN